MRLCCVLLFLSRVPGAFIVCLLSLLVLLLLLLSLLALKLQLSCHEHGTCRHYCLCQSIVSSSSSSSLSLLLAVVLHIVVGITIICVSAYHRCHT